MIFNLLTFLQAPAGQAAAKGSTWTFPVIMLLMFAVMWFFMIRPQQKKQKELREMRKTLGKGDKIITQGGIFGTIVEVKDVYFVIEVDNNVKLRVAKELVFKDASDLQQPR